MSFEVRSIFECHTDKQHEKLFKYSFSGPNPDHRKITLCYYVYSVAMKLLEELHPKAQSAFLKLPKKSYMELFSQFDIFPKFLI